MTPNQVSRWKVELQGHDFDLADLALASGGVGAKVVKEGKKWFLYSPSFEALNGFTEVYDEAERIVSDLEAVLKASHKDAAPISLGHIFDLHGGHQRIIRAAVGVSVGRSRVSAIAEAPPQSSAEPVLAKRARLRASDPEVRRAMAFLTASDSTFSSIYKAYEIVRDDLGGGEEGARKAAELAKVPLSELDAFYDNAHHQKLSGDKARHAGSIKRNEEPKTSRKMDLEGEARPLIRQVVLAWVDHKANHAGDPGYFVPRI